MIASGREIPVPGVKLKTWHDTHLRFNGPRRGETRAVVLHWTGGEGGGEQVHRVLQDRGLSVQFMIEQDGTVYQYCDADLRCSHAGEANAWSVGIEIANRASTKPHPKWTRAIVESKVHGKRFRHSAFYLEQLRSAEALTRALCAHYGLPYERPVADTALSPKGLSAWRGVLGHYHVTRRKTDPGSEVWEHLGL